MPPCNRTLPFQARTFFDKDLRIVLIMSGDVWSVQMA